MYKHDAASPSLDGPWIEIRGGRTRFPRRPIRGHRLLIGSGSNCDLQLGGGMPIAHSVISLGPDGWSIEALVSEPALMVANVSVRQATLRDGEVIGLGPFTLVAHLRAVSEEALLAPIDIAATLAEAQDDQAHSLFASLANMPAEELIDNLTAQITAAIIADQGTVGARAIIEEAIAAENRDVDEEQLVADVMAQLEEITSRIAARDADDGVVALPLPDRTGSAPLRKSA